MIASFNEKGANAPGYVREIFEGVKDPMKLGKALVRQYEKSLAD